MVVSISGLASARSYLRQVRRGTRQDRHFHIAQSRLLPAGHDTLGSVAWLEEGFPIKGNDATVIPTNS